MIELGVLMLLGLAVVAISFLLVVFKIVWWVVLLPFRILFWTLAAVVSLPLVLLGALGGALALVLALPLLLISLAGALVVGLLTLLMPLLLIALVVWLIWSLAAAPPSAVASP